MFNGAQPWESGQVVPVEHKIAWVRTLDGNGDAHWKLAQFDFLQKGWVSIYEWGNPNKVIHTTICGVGFYLPVIQPDF